MVKKIIFIVSIVLNVLFLLFLLLSLSGATSSFLLLNYGNGYINSAFIVSIPYDSDLSFGPVKIALRLGSSAYLQFAALRDGRQSNMSMEPLYDPYVVEVNQSGFGLVIRGVNPGEAVLQLFSPSGFKDIAYVTVYQ